MAIDIFVLRAGGNLFQANSSAYANAHFPKSVFVQGITDFPVAAEWSVQRDWSETIGVQRQERYDGARPVTALYTIKHSL